MKKRIFSILILLCLIVSVVPQGALAAGAGYEVYINGTEFKLGRSEINGAIFDKSTSTLTLRNLTINSGSSNAVIKADRSITIDVIGTNVINLSEGSTNWRTAFQFSKDVRITGSSAASTIVINSAVRNCSDSYDSISGVKIYRTGILSTGNGRLQISRLNLTMNDNSQSSYLGHSAMIDVYNGALEVENSRLTAKNLYCGIITDTGYTKYTGTEFDFTSSVSGSHGIATSYNTTNEFKSVVGTISADYGIRCFGNTEFNSMYNGSLNISGISAAVYIDREDTVMSRYPSVSFSSGTFNLTGANGIIVEGQSELYIGGNGPVVNIDTAEDGITVGATAGEKAYFKFSNGTLNIKNAVRGVAVNAGSTFHSFGNLTVTGKGATNSFGVQSTGIAEINGYVNISNYPYGIYTLKTSGYDTRLTLGGSSEQTVSATTAGLFLGGGNTVIQRDDASGSNSLTVNAPRGITPYLGGATLEIMSGNINLNSSTAGILIMADAGKTLISGGKINLVGTAEDSAASGIVSSGELEITGTADISFSNNKTDFRTDSGKGKITGGNIHLSSNVIGMYISGDYEISGGVIDSNSCSGYAIVHLNGDLKLSGGNININDSSVCLVAYGNSNIKFCGTDVSLKTTEQVALYSINDNNTYEISGGTVELKGSQYAANFSFSGSLPANYVALAGNDENYASPLTNPSSSVAISNKYVKFTLPKAYTLTLENVAEGTTASVNSGSSFTYTAAEAPVGKHFDHWEMKTGNGNFTSVGTNATYNGTMPYSDATLKAVYTDCTFDAKIENYDNFADQATCDHGAIYYYSCSVCGDSAKFVNNGPTFETGEKAGHDWSLWAQNSDGKTHTRVCANNNQHKETENCSGGTATCTAKAVCTKCQREYGDVADHSFTAQNTDNKYLASGAVCGGKATYYYSCSACGLKGTNTFEAGEKLEHAWGNWTSLGDGTHKRVCSNDSSHVETENCSGGTATCTSKAVCTKCQREYGNVGDHSFTAQNTDSKYLASAATCGSKATYYYSCSSCGAKGTNTFEAGEKLEHTWGNWTSQGDGTHKRVCSADPSHVETGTCSGGTATCTSKAVCAACGTGYGSLASHSFTARNTDAKYLYRAASCDNKATYYYSCSSCGAKGTNKFEIGDKTDHVWGNWTSVGDGTHKRVCSTNASHVETGTCSGGTATTESKAVCTVCGGEYGSLIPKNASVTIPTKATLAGDEVTVSVLVTSNPGLSHFEATITYDSSVLTLVGVSNGSFFDSSAFNAGTIQNNGTYKISFDSSSDVMKGSGVLVDLKFKVKEGNTVGTYPISVSGNVIAGNAAGSAIDCTVVNGGVKVVNPSSGLLGDVDGDGRVSSRDLLLYRRYLNGTVSDGEMFYTDCADLDGDGRISARDLLKLKQYLAGVVSL